MEEDGIKFFVKGIPKALPRQKYRLIKTKTGKQFISSYTPLKNVQTWYDLFIEEAKKYIPKITIDGPVKLECVIIFPRPKSHYNKKGELKSEEKYHCVRPDFDNVMKLICDVLTNLRYYTDDSQIADATIKKIYADSNECCGVEIKIKKLKKDKTMQTNYNTIKLGGLYKCKDGSWLIVNKKVAKDGYTCHNIFLEEDGYDDDIIELSEAEIREMIENIDECHAPLIRRSDNMLHGYIDGNTQRKVYFDRSGKIIKRN